MVPATHRPMVVILAVLLSLWLGQPAAAIQKW